MARTSFRSVQTVETVVSLDVAELTPTRHAFRSARTSKVLAKEGDRVGSPPADSAVEGVVNPKNLASLKKGDGYKTAGHWYVMRPEAREVVRTIPYALWNERDDAGRNVHASVFDGLRQDVYTAVAVDGRPLDDVVEFEADSQRFRDRHGDYLPTAVLLTGNDGRILDRTYDLRRLAEHLLKRGDVVLLARPERYGQKACTDRVAKTVEDAIHPGREFSPRTLWILWRPGVEDARRFWAKCRDLGNQRTSEEMYRAAFDLDVLGAKAAGIRLFDDYYGEPEERNEDEEDAAYSF